MHSMIRKRTVLSLTLLISAAVLFKLNFKSKDVIPKYFSSAPYFSNWNFNDEIACHYFTHGDILPSIGDMKPEANSIFFHETSCNGGLNSRQACSVESAARKHSHRTVYVLFNSPVSKLVLARSSLSRLKKLKNIILARVHSTEYTKDTALAELFAHKKHNHSNWKIEYTADMLKFITMYKYGGIYLDTGMLVVKPLDPLGENWVARQDEGLINVAAFSIEKDGVGHVVVSNILMDIKSDYSPQEWVYNGPGAMNRVLLKFCNATNIMHLTTKMCHGFTVYDPSKIYPVSHGAKDIYFTSGDLPDDKDSAYMYKLSKNETIEKDSPYDKLTLKHCPSIRKLYGDKFGT